MNLADMLSYSDIQQLGSIAKYYDCECNLNSKKDLIQSILTTVNRREVHEEIIDGSSIEELRFLNSLLFEKRNSFSIEELIARSEMTNFTSKPDEGWNPRDIITKFKQRGWLFNGYSSKNKYLFQVPQDLKKGFSDVLSERFQKSIIIANEPTLYRDEQSLLQDDIMQFLHFLAKQEVELTAEGYMYKRHLLQILDRLAVREEIVRNEAWRFGYGRRFREYPNRFSFIYDYCYRCGYIIEEQGALHLTERGQSRINEGDKESIAQIYHNWLQLYSRPIKNLASFIYWISQLANQWITVASLQQILSHYIKPFYFDTSEIIFEKRILQMMMHQGLLRMGHDEVDGYVMQVTALGSRIIQESRLTED